MKIYSHKYTCLNFFIFFLALEEYLDSNYKSA